MKTCKHIIYIILISAALFAAACDGTSTDEYLNGDFIDVTNDTTPPDAILPVASEKVTASPVVLQWTSKKGASYYTVEVTRNIDADFNTQIAGSPFTVTAPDTILSLDLSVQSSTYCWRVRADVTASGQYGQSSFESMDDTVYVYCPADVEEPDNTGMAGNISKPFQTIMRGLAEAERLDLSKVKVASRQYITGKHNNYEEIVVLKGGIDLLGAYTPDFTEAGRDIVLNRTYIQGSDGFTIRAQDVVIDTLLEGFIVNGSAASLASYALYIHDCPSDTLRIQSNTINGQDMFIAHMPDNTSCAVYLEDSGAIIENNEINSGSSNDLSYGIYINGGSVRINGNTIITERATYSYGIYNTGASIISGNTITRGGLTPAITSYGIYNTEGLWISENTIMGTGYGMYNAETCYTVIVNNVIVSGDASYSYGMYNENGCELELYNNTIVGGEATYVSYGMNNLSTTITLRNNIIAALDDTGSNFGYDGTSFTQHSYNCYWALSGSAYDPADLTLNTNEIADDPEFSDEYRLTTATAAMIRNEGYDLSLQLFSRALTILGEINYTPIDRDGNLRTSDDGWSMGAYEYFLGLAQLP